MVQSSTSLLFLFLAVILSGSAFAAPPPSSSDASEEVEEIDDPFEEEEETEGDDSENMESLLEEIEREFEDVEPSAGWEAPAEEPRNFPYVEQHGLFRIRPDFMYRLHLGTATFAEIDNQIQTIGTSGIRPPLTENLVNNDNPDFGLNTVGSQEDDSLAGVNMRFRYTPSVHISPELRVGLQFDILDNLVMGSTPDYGLNRPDIPLAALSETQRPPAAGGNSWRDSVRVKQAYGEWLSPIGLLRMGRQSAHWGMGILINDGQTYDADYGDFWDRALLQSQIPGMDMHLTLAWDFMFSGSHHAPESEFIGQSYDATDEDDVQQFTVAISTQAISEEERATRHQAIYLDRRPVFEWGIYYQYRSQDAEYLSTEGPDTLTLAPVDAHFHVPDVWARLDWSPAPGEYLHLEFEAAFVIGEVGFIPQTGTSADIQQLGGALAIDWTTVENQLTLGFDTGYASGDKAEYFGVRDHHNLGTPGDPNKKLAAFKFDRNFYVDEILFREVIGTVTNATYLKPWIQWDFFSQPDLDLGIRMDIEWGLAMRPEATPGNDFNLGVELDFSLFYQELGVFRADMVTAFFIPGDAFDLVPGYRDPDHQVSKAAEWAARIHSRLIWMF